MGLIYVKNKTNGITYVYESTNYWDKERNNRVVSACVLVNWMKPVI